VKTFTDAIEIFSVGFTITMILGMIYLAVS
jgi:flagellar biosynthesis protein FliR